MSEQALKRFDGDVREFVLVQCSLGVPSDEIIVALTEKGIPLEDARLITERVGIQVDSIEKTDRGRLLNPGLVQGGCGLYAITILTVLLYQEFGSGFHAIPLFLFSGVAAFHFLSCFISGFIQMLKKQME